MTNEREFYNFLIDSGYKLSSIENKIMKLFQQFDVTSKIPYHGTSSFRSADFLLLAATTGFFVASNEFIQGYAIVLSLLVLNFLVALIVRPETFIGALFKSIVSVGFISVICVLFLIPVHGKVAEFLLLHALSLTLLIITLVISLVLKLLQTVHLFWWVFAMVVVDFVLVTAIWLG